MDLNLQRQTALAGPLSEQAGCAACVLKCTTPIGERKPS